MPKLAGLAQRADFRLGDLRISPARRRVDGPGGSRTVEPQFMLVFLRLLDTAGKVVTRAELFEECWGGAAVGDDSLNRAVAGARQIATAVGSEAFIIETLPRTGYTLTLAPGVAAVSSTDQQQKKETRLQSAVEEAYDCWRTGLPTPDHDAIRLLRSTLTPDVHDARAWGMYALLLRKGAEYAEPDECADMVRACEQAARRAFSLARRQSDAEVALAGVIPIFGNWSTAREKLTAVRGADPDHIPAAHDMAVLEMATGRPSRAKPIIEELIARDPLAATFYYKRIYHLWTFDKIAEMDQVAARALQLWPRHPAIWMARFWTLLFTARADQALQSLNDETSRPPLPPPALDLLRRTCAVAGGRAERQLDQDARDTAISMAVAAAARGPAQAVAALLSLLAADAIDEAFAVTYGYYLGRGSVNAPLRWNASDPSITDQHRRVTQPLFTPAAIRMREDERFARLCDDIGLTNYWESFEITPDFLADT